VADDRELQRVGMLKNSEEFGEIPPDEVRDSPSSDTSAPSTDADTSELMAVTETSEVSINVNSPETLPSTEEFESEASAKELQEHVEAKSHTGENLTVFSSSEISAGKSDTASVCRAAEGTKSPESSFERKQQPSDTKQPNQLEISSEDLVLMNSAFEPDETYQRKEDVQVGVMSLRSLR